MIDVKPKSRCPGWRMAERHLARCDPVLGRIIPMVGRCTLAPRENYFACLCQSIITQQISTVVAVKIYGRFRGLFQGRRPVPRALLTMDESALRGVGLSQQKARYLRELAEAFEAGRVPIRRLRGMSDEEVMGALTPLRGIGRWTVEMFLIFVLNRLDVLPVDDFGLRKGVQMAYGLVEMPTAEQLVAVAEVWRPYRSIGTWYIWRGGAVGVLNGQAAG